MQLRVSALKVQDPPQCGRWHDDEIYCSQGGVYVREEDMQRNLSEITYVKKDMAPEAPHRHLTCYSQVSSPGMDNVLKAACRPAVEHMPTGGAQLDQREAGG